MQPYEYQRALAENEWPDILVAPTGLGKTSAVILGWAWRRLKGDEVPRRLIYCLPMRTLVEQTAREAESWFCNLQDTVSEANLPGGGDVTVLMGGEDAAEWRLAPDRPQLIIGTQDMLLSRALMRGYAMKRSAWPLDFALLHNDAQWVFDEVQLMGAGLATSAQLEAFRCRAATALPARSLWISATLDPSWVRTVDFERPPTVWRAPQDFADDAASKAVRRIVEAPKPIAAARAVADGAKKEDQAAYASAVAREALELRKRDALTLVVANTVGRAQAIHAALLNAGVSGEDLALVHSRFRPDDRARQMEKLKERSGDRGRIAVATQAIEAGIDISAAAMLTELAPWSSLVQRFGRVNRRGELNQSGGGTIRWIDLLAGDVKAGEQLTAPYEVDELKAARERLSELSDARPDNLDEPGGLPPARRVIRWKDLVDLFDTDPDLTGFDVDVSPYIRDAEDTDLTVFWRDLDAGVEGQSMPSPAELCAVPIVQGRDWIRKLRRKRGTVWRPDPQAAHGWIELDADPWPGLTLMVDARAGGYDPERGFDPGVTSPVTVLTTSKVAGGETVGDDQMSANVPVVTLSDHTEHVVAEMKTLLTALKVPEPLAGFLTRAARWHDLGKAHEVFQQTMRNGLGAHDGTLLAKSPGNRRHSRAGFRHELASALALLTVEQWRREADLVAYLIAAHHGKVRLSLRAWPGEAVPPDGRRFARGIHEGDMLEAVDLGDGESWPGGALTLSVMELGRDPETGASWTERSRALLSEWGPFRFAWAEALLRIADWRASAAEEKTEPADG